MKINRARATGAAAVAAVAVTGALAAPASEAQYNVPPKPVLIKMDFKGKRNVFVGPSKVERGAKLTFRHDSNPRKFGPHTASLAKKGLLPKGKAERRSCSEDLAGLCGTIARAHKIDFETFKIRKPDVDVGKKGWDKSFGKKGDTWFTEEKGESETRKVTAKAGSRLTFFCAVHPEMVKTIKVTR